MISLHGNDKFKCRFTYFGKFLNPYFVTEIYHELLNPLQLHCMHWFATKAIWSFCFLCKFSHNCDVVTNVICWALQALDRDRDGFITKKEFQMMNKATHLSPKGNSSFDLPSRYIDYIHKKSSELLHVYSFSR